MSRNLKSSISLDINFTYVCTKGYISKYAYMAQYHRRKLHLPGLITWEITQKRCKLCHKMFALDTLSYCFLVISFGPHEISQQGSYYRLKFLLLHLTFKCLSWLIADGKNLYIRKLSVNIHVR